MEWSILQLTINEINDVRMLLDSIYCLMDNISRYPQYGFKDIARLAHIAQELEGQVNSKISPVQKALGGATNARGPTTTNDEPFIFGKSPE